MALSGACLLVIAAGCETRPAEVNEPEQPEVTRPKFKIQPQSAEHWEAEYLHGVKIGYVYATRRPHKAADQDELDEVDSRTVLEMGRGDETSRQEMRVTSLEAPDGRLVSFRSEMSLGPTPMVVVGTVDALSLVLKEFPAGHEAEATERRIPLGDDVLGFSGMEFLLRQQPMRPNEVRQFRALVPMLNQVAKFTMAGVDYEDTKLLDADMKLLRIECLMHTSDDTVFKQTIWTTLDGEVLKSEMPAMQQVSYRCTREQALASPKGKIDIFRELLIKPKQPITTPPDAKRARYTVHSDQFRSHRAIRKLRLSGRGAGRWIDGQHHGLGRRTADSARATRPRRRAKAGPGILGGQQHLADS